MVQKFSTHFLWLLFFLFTSATVTAHNGVIKGIVINEANKHEMPNASIAIEGAQKSTITDGFGKFSFSGLQEKTYTLAVSYVGFSTQYIIVDVNELSPQSLKIFLKPSGLELSEVSIITRKKPEDNQVSAIDFKLRPIRTTQDMLRNVPGLFIAQHAGGGKAEQIFLRGFDVDHGTDINLTVDGMPVNMVSHAHGQGYSDLHWVIPETVEGFAFGKGPYYTEIGDFGTAGYVAFKTKDALDNNLVKAEIGNFNTYRGVVLLKMPFNEKTSTLQNGYIGGEYNYSDGPFDIKQNFKRINAIAKYNRYLNPNNKLTISGTYFSSTWNASGQIPERAVADGTIGRFGSIDPTEGGTTSRINANVQLISQSANGTTWKNQMYFSHYEFSLYSNFTFYLNDSINGDEIHQFEHRNIVGYNTSLNKESHIGNFDLTTTIGAGLRYDIVDNLGLEHVVARQSLGEYKALGDLKQANTFAWWNNNLQLSTKFIINAGIRYDNINYSYKDYVGNNSYNNANASRFSPKLNFYYLPTKNLKFFLNTGIGFHSNDARVAVPQNGKEILPPAYGADLGVTLKAKNKLILTASLWSLFLKQEFVYVGDEAVIEAGGRTFRMGIDISARYQIASWLFADVDLNYAHARGVDNPKGQNYIPLAPTFTSIGGLFTQFKNGISAAFRYRYIGDRPANEDNTVQARGYFINDLVLGYTHRRFDYNLSVENLFNIDWNEAQFDTETRLRGESAPVSELHYTPGSPFFIKFGITYRF